MSRLEKPLDYEIHPVTAELLLRAEVVRADGGERPLRRPNPCTDYDPGSADIP